MARFTIPPPAPVGGDGLSWTTQDLSTFALIDPNGIMDGATSLGTSSSLVVGQVHGRPDAGLDGAIYHKTLESGITWSSYRGLLIRVEIGTWPTANGGVFTSLLLGVLNTAAQTSGNGFFVGGVETNGGATRTSTLQIGSGINNGSGDLGACSVLQAYVDFNDGGWHAISGTVNGASADESPSPLSLPKTPTDLILALALGNSATPTGDVTFGGVVLKTALVPAPT